MALKVGQYRLKALLIVATTVMVFGGLGENEQHAGERAIEVPSDSARCVRCHGVESDGGGAGIDPGVVMHWEASAHAEQGVGCLDCHGVPKPGEVTPDLLNPRYVVDVQWDKKTGLKTTTLVMEKGRPVERPDIRTHDGADVVTNVSPRTCAQCHESEAEEFYLSRHSSAAQFLGSLDNFLGRFAEGPAAANSGCQQCHGSALRVAPTGADGVPMIAPDTWPNTGIGRVNLDGSWGSCTACHSRHEFSAEVARRPDNCGKCHMGPDHPQMEIFTESKHGIAYKKNARDMKMDVPGGEWILGKTYAQAPTCATCHMGAVAPQGVHAGLPVTHDIGSRISWTLRPKISYKPAGIKALDGTVILKDPEGRRGDMQATCKSCHSKTWVDGFYVQYDQAVELYNNKYGKPGLAIYQYLKDQKIIDAIPMNEEMDYVWFEIWHHEGRRARHGASMMGPDYVQWHGFYELSKNFYTHFIPLARELSEKKGKAEDFEAFLKKTLRGENGEDWERYHRWTEGLSPEEKKSMLDWERETYGPEK